MAQQAGGLLARGHDDEVLEASRVSRFAISSPPTALSAAWMVGLAVALAAVLWAGPAKLPLEAALAAATLGALAPAAAFALAAFAYFRATQGTITAGRCALLAVTDLGIALAFSAVASVVPGASADLWLWALLLAAAFGASVNTIVLAGTSEPSLRSSMLPTLLAPATAIGALRLAGFAGDAHAVVGAAFVPVFLFAAALWVSTVIAPFRRAFNENGLELLHAVLDAWAGWSRPPGSSDPSLGTLRMEAFFARHGKPSQVRFHALRFRQQGGRRLMWFLPQLHPGPYADLGGSDLPAKAAASLAGAADDVAVFHGATTHDENPTGREELAKVLVKVAPALEAAQPSGGAGRPVRAQAEPFSVVGQRLGAALVLAQSRAPRSSDDIDSELGRQVEAQAAAAGFEPVLLLDGHNAVEADLGRIQVGTADGARLVATCGQAALDAAKAPQGPLLVGWSRRALSGPERLEFAVGSQGILATVTQVDGARAAFVLIDGNNLKAGLRGAMLEALAGKAEVAEVFTTDNHAVNTTMGADNEVGSSRDNAPLVAWVAAAVDGALADLKPADVQAVAGHVGGVKVFGEGLTVKISETIRAATRLMVPAYVLTTAVAVAACVAMALLLT